MICWMIGKLGGNDLENAASMRLLCAIPRVIKSFV